MGAMERLGVKCGRRGFKGFRRWNTLVSRSKMVEIIALHTFPSVHGMGKFY